MSYSKLAALVIPIPVQATRYVRGIEFRPGNTRVVHHANMRIDPTSSSRLLDEADPEPGFDGPISRTADYPDGHFLGWTPGQLPPLLADGMAWRVEPGSDLVLQLHMQPTDGMQLVQASIGLFFTERPPARLPMMVRLGRQNIAIPPGDIAYRIEDRFVLPVDVEVLAVQPHAHYRAKEIKGFATLPDGSRKWLIYIRNWDFQWQDLYRYERSFVLPRGTTLEMQYTYDNSAGNRRNPDRPPRRVRWGQNSTDEMGDLWIQVLPRTVDDRERLSAEYTPKALAEDAAGFEKLLEVDPDNTDLHDNAALIYLSIGKIDAAVSHLLESLRVKPGSAVAQYNMGTGLVAQGRLEEALAYFRRALLIKPDGEYRFVEYGDTPLGMFDETHYHQHFIRFEEGQVLVIYTDGITEAANPTGEEYGQ